MSAVDDRILPSIKKLLGMTDDYDYFDQDIIIHINTAFATLKQIGVGPTNGFYISGDDTTWSEFVTTGTYEDVKTYVYLRVKLVFDPPSSSAAMESYKAMINELEWRLQVESDETKNAEGEEEIQNGV